MAKGNHSFTEQEIRKRFGAIIGHTVAEVDTAGVLTASAASRNKGRIGAVIEQSVLGYPADSDRRPDIVIDGQPWEVKATGLKEGVRGGWCAKEPMSITAVAPEGIVTESFSTSAFWHKAELENELEREAAREGVELKSLRLCGWKYLGRFMPFEWLPLNEIGTAEDANLLAAAVMRDPDIDCDVLFQYCDLREIFEPLGYINVALQYDALPYRKWTSPLDLKEIGMDFLSPNEVCDLQLGWEMAGKDTNRDRNDMSVVELIELGEKEAESRDLVVWRYGYMDPYEGEIDTAKYSKEQIITTLFPNA